MGYPREKHAEYMRQRSARIRAEFFSGKSCVRCGSKESLELDHIDPNEKVGHRIWSWSKDRRAAEISKCQVLCTGCHIEKTRAERRSKVKHGTESMYKLGCKCDDCREAKRVARARQRAQQRERLNRAA